MPVNFLSPEQEQRYGRFAGEPSEEDFSRYFHFDEADLALIRGKRGKHNRFGFAMQLCTVRYLGTFQNDPFDVPSSVLLHVATQLGIQKLDKIIREYNYSKQRRNHAAEISERYGYIDISEPRIGLRLTRWLYNLCWIGNERPGILFERAIAWLLTHKVLLPGCSQLERYIARLRQRVEEHLWKKLERCATAQQQAQLETLLAVPEGEHESLLTRLKQGAVKVSVPSMLRVLKRLESVRLLKLNLSAPIRIPQNRILALARFASTVKTNTLTRLPRTRRMAALVAFVHYLEPITQDDALELLEALLREVFSRVVKINRKNRLRTVKDLDQSASVLADVCKMVLDPQISEDYLRRTIFAAVPPETLTEHINGVVQLIRPFDDVYFQELDQQFIRVRRFFPDVLKHLRLDATPAGQPLMEACDWLRRNWLQKTANKKPPLAVVGKSWLHHVCPQKDEINLHAYIFCVLDNLRASLRRREIFAVPGLQYADPRSGLLQGPEWEAARPIICRSLKLSVSSAPVLRAMSKDLDQTYRKVAARLSDNKSIRFEAAGKKETLVLSPLEAVIEPESLKSLREAVYSRLPRVDLPEILLEIAAHTGFTDSFTHISENSARATDLHISLCAVLLAEACNTGLEPLVRNDIPALKRDRLSWVEQNYIRNETLSDANAILVATQNRLELAHIWGGGEVASADGLRFVVPIRTIHAAPNPKYFGLGRGLTWYNLISDQYSGLNAILVPGTLRDSLILMAVVLEQQTELEPFRIMTDTGAYSDVVFGLFRLLGYRFAPRIADIGGTRLWRIDPKADYGDFNRLSCPKINTNLITQQWDDLLRLVGSLKLGCVSPSQIMRTLQVGDRPTKLARALAEIGRIDKTLHLLTYIDDEDVRRNTLIQLNRGEARHSLARILFHGQRGEIRQHYREGQEDQLGAMGLVLNMIVLWNTMYMELALKQLRTEGFPVLETDVVRLSPLGYPHINMEGRYSFSLPDFIMKGKLRPLRKPGVDV